MRHVPTLLRRELAAYFLGPVAFLILLAFQAIAWLNFWELIGSLARNGSNFSGFRDPINSYVSGSFAFWIGILVAVPALTMRLIAEERRSGTLESLLTSPVTETEVVIAKWLGGVIMYLVILIPYALYLPFLYFQGKYRFDLGPVLALGIGLTTVGMMFVAIGLFFSAMTKNQVVAAIWTFSSLLFLTVVTWLIQSDAASRRLSWAEGIRYVSVMAQVESFGTGQLDLRFLALHLSACVLLLYLTVKVLEFRREG